MNVSRLWQQLEKLENEHRFDGAAYPDGLAPFPFRLSGQGFFPGGDGLWRDKASAPSTGELPTGGILFLAADFGTLGSYNKLCTRGYQNELAWKNLRRRILDAGLPTTKIFCSKIYPGLRTDQRALGVYPAVHNPEFPLFSAEMLRFQIEVLSPKLIVSLGPVPEIFVHRFNHLLVLHDGSRPAVFFTPHPGRDSELLAPMRRHQLAAELREAWENTQPVPYRSKAASGVHRVAPI
jgi:hypothetical protein